MKSGGDTEWGKRVFSRGYSIIYADDCYVDHPARYSLAQLYNRVARVRGGTYYRLDKNKDAKYALMQLLTDLSCLRPPINYIMSQFFYFSTVELKNNRQKIQVFLVALFVHYAEVLEEIRLRLGGNPKR